MTYDQSLNYIFSQLPMYQRQGKAAFKKDLSKTIALCKVLQNPEKDFKSIHIAGTNGKGSVAHILSSIFQTAGYKTGLYTSPHLKDFRERIKIDGKMVAKKKVRDFIVSYKSSFEKIEPSFFEWSVAFALSHFSEEKVDIAIIETGLGGRLDSTNIIQPELSIITNIGLDHTEMLGDTLAEIAKEKAGIIKENTAVLIGDPSGQSSVFDDIAKMKNAAVHYLKNKEISQVYPTDLKGHYQNINIRIAHVAGNIMQDKGWKIKNEDIEKGLLNVIKNTGLKGRWQQLKSRPKVIADTAHNKEGFQHVLKQIQSEEFERLHFVLGFVKEKPLTDLLQSFPKNASYYFCQAKIPRALNATELQEIARKQNLIGSAFGSVEKAYAEALKSADSKDFIFIGGSNFVVAELV